MDECQPLPVRLLLLKSSRWRLDKASMERHKMKLESKT